MPRVPSKISEIYSVQKLIKRIETPNKTTKHNDSDEKSILVEKQDVRYLKACLIKTNNLKSLGHQTKRSS